MVIYPYRSQNLAEVLVDCSPVSMVIEGKHENLAVVADLPDLTRLEIRGSTVDELDFLAASKLRSLLLSRTRIASIEPLPSMPHLEVLRLWANPRLKDFRSLVRCHALQNLSFYSCHDVLFPEFSAIPMLSILSLDCCSGVAKSSIEKIRSRVAIHDRKTSFDD